MTRSAISHRFLQQGSSFCTLAGISWAYTCVPVLLSLNDPDHFPKFLVPYLSSLKIAIRVNVSSPPSLSFLSFGGILRSVAAERAAADLRIYLLAFQFHEFYRVLSGSPALLPLRRDFTLTVFILHQPWILT